jgi:O-antigen/teichoic acid export membrane protein
MFSKQIMTFLFGIEYREAGPIAFFLFIGFAFKLIGKPLEAHFNEIVGNPTIIAGIHIISITMMALLTYFGAVQFGLAGAAIGSSAAMLLGALALLMAYTRSTGYHFANLLSLRALLVTLSQIRLGRQ